MRATIVGYGEKWYLVRARVLGTTWMCGIAGLIDLENTWSSEKKLRLVEAMANTMIHRGPDQSGAWQSEDGRCALSHRRLSIIDLTESGRQPMVGEDGENVITFNGEVYNFTELRQEFEESGVRFRTGTDTEVFLKGMQQEGLKFLERIDGMYAIAYYDAHSRQLILARDAFGEKPLYYTAQNGIFAFASELHALAIIPDFDDAIDDAAVANFLAFQYLPTPTTIYRSVHRLPPGSYLILEADGRIRSGRHFAFQPNGDDQSHRSIDDLADELEEILVRSIRRRLVSDVPLGAFLSGGVDSSLVCALVTRRLNRSLKTFSIGFTDAEDSEHLYARQMAEHIGTEHHEKMLSPEVMDLAQLIGRVLDEPNGDSSCLPTYLLSQFARESVTVALSGDGGDELFGGYGRYFITVDEDRREMAGDTQLSWWRPAMAYFPRVMVFPKAELSTLFPSLPLDCHLTISALEDRLERREKSLLDSLREIDAETYLPGAVLPKVDRMSMQHSLEVRAPLLSPEVARFAARLTSAQCYDGNGQGKLVLKRLAGRYIPMDWLARRKMGFGLPMTLWGKESLLPSARRLLLDETQGQLLRWIPVPLLRTFLDAQKQSFSTYRVWSLMILEIWLRSHPASRRSNLV